MDYICTRSGAKKIGAAEAVLSGASDSGYYVPETLPRVTKSDLEYLCDCDYAERAAFVMKLFFAELGYETIENICTEAAGRFERDDPAPLVCLEDDEYILELFHGKSGSQADINAAFLIPLICESAVKAGLDPDKICLLAFGADEGAAMISEAKKSPISHVIAVFDGEKTSMIQRKQLAELSSEGFEAIEIPEELNERIKEKVFCCGSEKKLVPTGTENVATAIIETVNFISAYCDVVNSGAIGLGDEINFAMPCGDLTNLLACKYARQMGVPIKRIVCGENANERLGEFFDGGELTCEINDFTISPSVDLNDFCSLERLIFEISGRNPEKTAITFSALENGGRAHYDGIRFLTKEFYFGSAEDDDVLDCIAYYFDEYGYVFGVDSSVGAKVGNDYFNDENDYTPIVYLATSSPFKFPCEVFDGVAEILLRDPLNAAERIFAETGMPLPAFLGGLKEADERKILKADPNDLSETVKSLCDEKY